MLQLGGNNTAQTDFCVVLGEIEQTPEISILRNVGSCVLVYVSAV